MFRRSLDVATYMPRFFSDSVTDPLLQTFEVFMKESLLLKKHGAKSCVVVLLTALVDMRNVPYQLIVGWERNKTRVTVEWCRGPTLQPMNKVRSPRDRLPSHIKSLPQILTYYHTKHKVL